MCNDCIVINVRINMFWLHYELQNKLHAKIIFFLILNLYLNNLNLNMYNLNLKNGSSLINTIFLVGVKLL